MKVLFLGDSITQGCGASTYENSYVYLAGQKLNAEVYNYGIGGTRLARQKFVWQGGEIYAYDFNQRLDTMQDDADAVVIFGGTNDFGHGCAPIGKDGDTDVYTFYGAIDTLFANAVKKYGNKKILLVIPIPRFNQDNPHGDGDHVKLGITGTLETYNNIIKEKANKYNIKYVDYSNDFPVPSGPVVSDLFADGLHPNDKGHALLADLITRDLKKYIL